MWTNVLQSEAYYALDAYARAAYVELCMRYNGENNGRIGLSVRELAWRLRCSPNRANKALTQINDADLAYPTFIGSYRNGGRATEWLITAYACKEEGHAAKTQWSRHPSYAEAKLSSQEDRPVHVERQVSAKQKNSPHTEIRKTGKNDQSKSSDLSHQEDTYRYTRGTGENGTRLGVLGGLKTDFGSKVVVFPKRIWSKPVFDAGIATDQLARFEAACARFDALEDPRVQSRRVAQ